MVGCDGPASTADRGELVPGAHVLRLRKSLAAAGAQHLVQTVRGLGYRLSARAEQ
jgi:DNA-binding response OmpR family regulator